MGAGSQRCDVDVAARALYVATVFSLQAKLDQIAREREILSVLQSLARLGFREGDAVVNVSSHQAGRIAVQRGDGPAVAIVRTAAGSIEAFDAALWRSAGSVA